MRGGTKPAWVRRLIGVVYAIRRRITLFIDKKEEGRGAATEQSFRFEDVP